MEDKISLAQQIIRASQPGSGAAEKGPRKALAWGRVSTEGQEERGLSIPEQLREIEQYAERHGIEIVETFQEAASAFRHEERRHEFRRMIEVAKARADVTIILVHDLSRFSRDSMKGRQLFRDLKAQGLEIVSLNDPDMDTETVSGVYLEAITFAKNEAFSREVAFHTRKGCRANVQTRDPETGWCYKNGGQPLWGYRLQQLDRGQVKHGRPQTKSVWVPDETIVAGQPTMEWARHCFVNLAANGASLEELRDFCNHHAIPARRNPFWSTSTWNSLLEPNVLLQYCGFGVWNVHHKNGRKRPPSEWLIVEKAHQALITEDEARAVLEARERKRHQGFDAGYGRSRESRYLLSGGLFKCARCGNNMIGRRVAEGQNYYVCGSQPYRKGLGCGPGVYVPQQEVEAEVMAGLQGLLGFCSDAGKFTRMVNDELSALCGATGALTAAADKSLKGVEQKIANVRTAIEDGLADAARANERLRELQFEKQQAEVQRGVARDLPMLKTEEVMAYRRDTERLLAGGSPADLKRLVRNHVSEMKLTPDDLTVEIQYKVPEPVVNGLVARRGFEPLTSRL
ncbi:recombinase family protein [bacterium]|nr:recombinase family protein [bacterium]